MIVREFFKSLFLKKELPVTELPVSLNEKVETYQQMLLQKVIMQRTEQINRLATWQMEELNETINDYQKELTYCKITEDASMCDIFEEKIYQLNAAREILEKKLFQPIGTNVEDSVLA